MYETINYGKIERNYVSLNNKYLYTLCNKTTYLEVRTRS